ncbi:hypothetical protein ACHHYP_08042 [Achlya hypogyna]|uniref:Uncharacterized protein n=1 Tax=Achlya hypogyna TaxID=1202772 RepID=A0A1V9YPV4_ACHHY|nr:hypothetical protein ACHHYP_08042 [Achlya hypogyna]
MHPDLEAHLADLKARQRNMVARRVALEKKQQMRDATMAEFSVAYTDMLKRKQRQHQQNAVYSKRRNQEFLARLHEYERSLLDVTKTQASAVLNKAKVAFADKVMEVYPAWQEELQRLKMQQLRQLEQEKHEIEYRRLLAKQSFEKEQGLEALLRQTAHDINLVTSVERNETYERQLFRQQKLKEAMDLEEAIRLRAEEERRRMEEEHFRTLVSPTTNFEQLSLKYAAAMTPLPSIPEPFLASEPPAHMYGCVRGIRMHHFAEDAEPAKTSAPPLAESPLPMRTSAFPPAESPVPARTSAFPSTESPVPQSSALSCADASTDEFEFQAPSPAPSPSPSPTRQLGTTTARLSDTERLTLVTQLVERIESSARDGDVEFTESLASIEVSSKHDLLKMATSGRKAQMNVFGTDVCFALLLDALQDIGPYLFTEELMVGKMTLQRLTKAYQHNRNKEKDYWRLFTSALTTLVTQCVMTPQDASQVFSKAFMTQLPKDERTARKLRELLLSICPEPQANAEKKPPLASTAPTTITTVPTATTTAPVAAADVTGHEAKSVLSLAFMRQNSQPASTQPAFGRSKTSPAKGGSLGQRVLRGASLRDYSDFEVDDDDVDFSAPSLSRGAMHSTVAKVSSKPAAATKRPTVVQDDDFDENF